MNSNLLTMDGAGVLLLIDVAVKTFLLMGVTCVAALLMRKRSAATVHRVWALGFGGCLVVPVIALVAPAWTLPILPAVSSVSDTSDELTAETGFESIVDGRSPAPSETIELEQQVPAAKELPQAPVDLAAGEGSQGDKSESVGLASVAAIDSSRARAAERISYTKLLLLMWSGGALVFIAWIVWHQLMLVRLLSKCDRIESVSWKAVVDETRLSLGMKRTVHLRMLAEARSPIVAGMFRTVVVVPSDAGEWSTEQRRFVLLHELAHAKRWDILTQSVARFVCALHWFNPVAWFGLLQMRKLRELACDDLVVAVSDQPADYADVLLGVARSYRHRSPAMAVAMARSSNVEKRIMAVLDLARSRASLTGRAARTLLAVTAVFVGIVGTVRFESQAESTADVVAEGDAKEAKEVDEDLRTMEIRIRDEQGEPIVGANLHIGVWYMKDYEGEKAPKDYETDEEGRVLLRIPKRLRILRLWPSKPGYVPLFKNFGEGKHQEGELIPDEYEFRLARGHEIGGRIVDEEGKPIEGVRVRVRYDQDEPAWTVDTRPRVSTWLTESFSQPTVITDAEGRWKLGNAPAPYDGEDDNLFRVKLSHDDYITDEHWGDAQRAQGVTASDLRRGDATIALRRGASISGLITDVEGARITRGWVVWHDEPYFNDGEFETEIKSDGTFRTPPLADGEHPITVVAPGFAAQRRVVRIGSDSTGLQFQLRPGKRIEIRFVDEAGSPVPKVGVYLANTSVPNTWQGSNALHNHKHSNVPEYGIPRHAGKDGVFLWEWAPEEPVRYSVGAKGFAPQELSLVAKSEPHVITLADARVVEGLVTDATTGDPVESFQAMPVIVYRANFYSTRFSDVKLGENGRYELPLSGSGDPEDRYRVRIEAEGYRSVVSEESFGPRDGRVELNVQLERSPVREGRVVDSEGNPVSGATVIEGTPTWVPMVTNGDPDSYGERILRTDSEGRFKVHATTEPVRVRALHDSGMVEKLVQPDEGSIGDMQIQPWASIAGRLVQDGQPVGDQSIYFNSLARHGLGEARFQDSYSARTNTEGFFELERLPPGVGNVRTSLGPWRDSPLTSGESFSLELKPGETREILLGGEGAVLTGQVVATGREEAPLDRNWSLNYLVSRDRGMGPPYPDGFPELSFDPSGPMQLGWSLDPHFHDWLSTRENHFVKLTADGDLRVTGVAPGEYDLVIRLYEQPAGCLVETVGEKIVVVRVEGDGEIDLGQIEVPCRAGPRVGSDMRAFEFVDATGRAQSISDMAGRYVLMHVWASWCGPCLESVPDLQATVESLADQPITFVGLNVDKDTSHAKDLAEQRGLNWSQMFLGDESDLARQLAISSVPTYYLIGPDGKLATSSREWLEVKEAIGTSLEENRE